MAENGTNKGVLTANLKKEQGVTVKGNRTPNRA